VDVLFTDIGLPGMRGPELAMVAMAERPELKVIFASGYAEADGASAMAGAVHLGKPYQQDELAEVLTVAMAS
jgi:CheY-like chemotaxis protein